MGRRRQKEESSRASAPFDTLKTVLIWALAGCIVAVLVVFVLASFNFLGNQMGLIICVCFVFVVFVFMVVTFIVQHCFRPQVYSEPEQDYPQSEGHKQVSQGKAETEELKRELSEDEHKFNRRTGVLTQEELEAQSQGGDQGRKSGDSQKGSDDANAAILQTGDGSTCTGSRASDKKEESKDCHGDVGGGNVSVPQEGKSSKEVDSNKSEIEKLEKQLKAMEKEVKAANERAERNSALLRRVSSSFTSVFNLMTTVAKDDYPETDVIEAAFKEAMQRLGSSQQ